MTTVVVDASVAIKWFLPEVHAPAARRLLQGRRELLAPDLIWAEVGNTLWNKCRHAELTEEEARGILRDFRRFPLHISASHALLEAAWELTRGLAMTLYGGLYLALAVSHACPLVTADRKLCIALQRHPAASALLWVEDVLMPGGSHDA